ncbi:transposase domain-containing protein [Streptomyces sp. NPDC059593]|uniref:transposase domain-containing protein n=1 Tax=Streptomyces sp. NPDC059593 TaxID=3346878 RepID=UPI0036C2BAE4
MRLPLSCGDRCPACDGWGAGQRVRIGILTKVFSAGLVDAAIAKHDRAERRRRLLPARLVVYFVLALCLFARESYEEVLRVLTSGIPGSRALARGGPTRSRTPEGVRQELWAYLAVHHAIRQFAHTAALARPTVDAGRVSYLKCVRIVRRSIPSQLGATATKLTRSFAEAGREARARLLPARRGRECPRAIKKPNRWPVLRTRARRDTVQPGRWAHNQTTKPKSNRRAGRPVLRGTRASSPPKE